MADRMIGARANKTRATDVAGATVGGIYNTDTKPIFIRL